jgi:hypothetical protein
MHGNYMLSLQAAVVSQRMRVYEQFDIVDEAIDPCKLTCRLSDVSHHIDLAAWSSLEVQIKACGLARRAGDSVT